MGLKLLIFPASVILSIIIVIWFIYPGITRVLEQRALQETKQVDLSQVETVEGNIRAMSQSLNARRETEALVKRYYPENMDQERAVDMVNFLAQQSGVVITSLDLRQDAGKPKRVEAPAPIEGEGTSDGATPPETSVDPPKSYHATIALMGPYENIRSFFERLYRTDRLRVMNALTISEIKTRSQGEEEAIPDNFLAGTVLVDFTYASQKKATNVLHHPLFQTATLDYADANKLTDFINSPVSDLATPPVGRTNPFEALP